MNIIEKLAPFCRRAQVIVTGRRKLEILEKKLSFILVTTDLSETSLNKALEDYAKTPIIQWGTSEQIQELFGCENTKILGFLHSTLSEQIFEELKNERL